MGHDLMSGLEFSRFYKYFLDRGSHLPRVQYTYYFYDSNQFRSTNHGKKNQFEFFAYFRYSSIYLVYGEMSVLYLTANLYSGKNGNIGCACQTLPRSKVQNMKYVGDSQN